ncbi:TonB-dependent receptor [Ketogulonicigenium vulgare]|uniref:TonB-dependent receptor n=1 Tax=Ketogulonicigenium vulgare TaxID=92945 RepID=UPI002358532E|nr:TonB-dependent receptor [Ketogulonicigenium vulgare]
MALGTRARLTLGVSTLSFALAAALPLAAQQTSTNLGNIYISLTGDRGLRNQQDTANSVEVKTAEDLAREHAGADSLSTAISGTANLVYPDNVSAPVIRGLDTQGPNTGAGAFFSGTVPRVAVSIDGHYLGFNELYYGASSIWDSQSLEVYRGPQTTSQGANAIAGAIVVNTNDPTFTPEGAYRAEVGSNNSRRVSLAYSSAITDNLAGRISVDYTSRDTFINYTNPSFTTGDADHSFQNLNLRGKLLWLPSDMDGLSVKLTFSHSDTNRPTQEMATAPYSDLNNAYATTVPGWDQQQDGLVLDIEQDFGNGMVLTNQTQASYGTVERRVGTGNGDADITTRDFSNETRLTFGQQGDAFTGLAGLFVRRVEADEALRLTAGNSSFDDTKINIGVFGEATWNFAERWSLNAGLRLQSDQIERLGTSYAATLPATYDQTFTELLPKLALTYEVTPDFNIGGMISRGYNPGGLTLNLSSKEWQEFDAEKIWNYELFSRATLLEERLFLTTNIFYMDYEDQQYNIAVEVSPGVTQSYTINAEQAHSYGLEVGLDFAASDTLKLRASAGLLRTGIDEVTANSSYEGNEFAKSPSYTLALGADWQATEALSIAGSIRAFGGYYSDIANTEAYVVDDYALADLQAAYRFDNGLEIYGYVNNVFDERVPTAMQYNRTGGGIEASITTPRTVGLGVRGTF